VSRYLYLSFLLFSLGGVLVLNLRFHTEVIGRRLLRTALITVPLFLCFDVVGTARGWFASSPRLNSVIVTPGIPLEDPILLGFLTLISVSLWWAARRVTA
jgi:lycopene cyclase domain-containing protein